MEIYQYLKLYSEPKSHSYIKIKDIDLIDYPGINLEALMLFQKKDLIVENKQVFFQQQALVIQDRIRLLYAYQISDHFKHAVSNDLYSIEKGVFDEKGLGLDLEYHNYILSKFSFQDYKNAIRYIVYKNCEPESELVDYIFQGQKLEIYKIPGFFSFFDQPYILSIILDSIKDTEIVKYDITPTVHQKLRQIDKGYQSQKRNQKKISERISDQVLRNLTISYLYELNEYASSLNPRFGDKIIVLTEGKTDSEFLKKAMEIIYPNYSEYFYFMDFGISKSMGGAGDLTNKVKAFISSGIKNRIVAIYDNDAVGFDSTRALEKIKLPDNIIYTYYPDLDFMKKYPTKNPETQEADEIDISGKACSIEMYFGFDVIKNTNGSFPEIEWKGYVDSIGRYQGVVKNKSRLQKLFRSKLKNAAPIHSQEAPPEWEHFKSILDEIVTAHLD